MDHNTILLAKNLKEGCRFLVFDDVVNAIDHEHRLSILETLFHEPLFEETQIVLTSHGQEFISTIQQELGSERVKNDVLYYRFLPHVGDFHPDIELDGEKRNYILRAESNYQNHDDRNALIESRRALERLSRRLWGWLCKKNRHTVKGSNVESSLTTKLVCAESGNISQAWKARR